MPPPRVSTSARKTAMTGEPWPMSGNGVYVEKESGLMLPLLFRNQLDVGAAWRKGGGA